MRILYVNFFNKDEISGGIKTAYRNVEILNELGFPAFAWQQAGHPDWFTSKAPVLRDQIIKPDDILVFPEYLRGGIGQAAKQALPCTKILFCQNQHYVFNDLIPKHTYADLGFSHFAASSKSAQAYLERVFGLRAALIPYYIDPAVFRPRNKKRQIAFVPRKMPDTAQFIRQTFQTKYPYLRDVRWVPIDGLGERKAAEIMGESLICLSLAQKESLGLVGLEAMASGTAVIGYHGYGGLEYASEANGRWFGADETEAVADALADTVTALDEKRPDVIARLESGTSTAARYNREATSNALKTFFDAVVA